MLSPLEKLNQALRENRPEDFIAPRHQELGMCPLQFGPGTSLWEWDAIREQVLNAFGYVAGGYLTVFADELLGSAIGSVLDNGEFATTAELKISFLKPVAKGLVRGEGKVIRRGKQVAFVEATMKNAKDEVVATVSSTWIIVAGKS